MPDLVPVDHDPFAVMPRSKTGAPMAAPPIEPQEVGRQRVTGAASQALGIDDAMRAWRGEMTENEAMNFAFTSALGLIPGARAAGPAEKAATAAIKVVPPGLRATIGKVFSSGGGLQDLRNLVAKGLSPHIQEGVTANVGRAKQAAADLGGAGEESLRPEEAVRQARAIAGEGQGAPSWGYRRTDRPGIGDLGGITYSADPRVAAIWGKAGISAPDLVELPKDKSAAFKDAISAAKAANPYGAAVSVYPDYSGMRTFLTPDRKAGFALDGDDIISLFRHPNSDIKSATVPMLDLALSQGGRRLDAFDTVLPHLYSRSGFKAVARTGFDPKYQPADWDTKTFAAYKGGKPDVVSMVYDPKFPGYKPGDGKRVSSYDMMQEISKAAAGQSPVIAPAP